MRREDLASRLSDVEQRLRLRAPDAVMGLERLGSLGADPGTLVVDIDLDRIDESRIHQDYLKDLRDPPRSPA